MGEMRWAFDTMHSASSPALVVETDFVAVLGAEEIAAPDVRHLGTLPEVAEALR